VSIDDDAIPEMNPRPVNFCQQDSQSLVDQMIDPDTAEIEMIAVA
jgi:hypothetical protein